jgi:long-chain fatty acid transport protein
VHVDWGSLEIRRKLDFVAEEGDSHLRMSGVSAGADASLYYQATDTLSFGLSYQSRTLLKLSGEASFTVPDTFAGRAPDQLVSSEMTLPDRFALGGAWRRGRVAVLADVTLTLWSVRDTVRIDFEKPETSDVVQPQKWQESFSVRAGAEYWAHPKVAIRGGAYYDHQASPDQTLAPSSPDLSRLGLTLGGSWQVHPAVAVDLSYSLVFLLPRSSTSDDAIPASYSGQLHMLGLAFRGARPRAL